MLGLGVLVGLGRRLVKGPLADSGLLPAGFYRHLVLAAIEEEDFPTALRYLPWAADLLLIQILIVRLRLLRQRHEQECQAILRLLGQTLPAGRRCTCEELLSQAEQAHRIIKNFEVQALEQLQRQGR
jgi:hypothetical protein